MPASQVHKIFAGWTVFASSRGDAALGAPLEPTQHLRLLFMATSSHKTLAAYRIVRDGHPPLLAGILSVQPFLHVVELAYFDREEGLDAWLLARCNHDRVIETRSKKQ